MTHRKSKFAKVRTKVAKKISLLGISILVLLLALLGAGLSTIRATGYGSVLTATLNSVVANGSAATLLTYRVFENDTGVSGLTVSFAATGGEFNILSPRDGQRPEDGPNISLTTDTDGYAIAQFRSASSGTKTVTASVDSDASLTQTISIVFTPSSTLKPPPHMSGPLPLAPSAPSAPSTPNTQSGNVQTPSTSAPVSGDGTVAQPTLQTVKVGGKTLSASESISLSPDVPIELTGTTVANGKVTLYIYSDPTKAEVKADDKGNWTYTIKGLAVGSHRVEAEVTDPSSKKTSARASILSFKINSPASIGANPSRDFWSRWYRQIVVASALVAVGGAYLFYRLKRTR